MSLPIHEVAEEIQFSISTNERILLKAPTGSGKSTEVPGLIVDSGAVTGQILVIEPRRMAARLLAGHVAQKRKTKLGDEVGYAVRFDRKYSDATRIIYLTDGVFQRILQNNPTLQGISAVVFDEFHERRLAIDMALGKCLNLQETERADLRIVVMSATLDTGALGEFLEPVRQIEASGRTFPVEILYRPHRQPANSRGTDVRREIPIWEKVVALTKEALKLPDPGNVLIFLPGTFEIRRTVDLLSAFSNASGYEVFPLYSGLPPQDQEKALAASNKPRIIVSTNVAETSLTIPGVKTVIDSGLARSASFDPRRGINTLTIQKSSRAAADQRAGRAGRTDPGRCLRLWPNTDHARREEFEKPEIHRIDLSAAILDLKSSGCEDVATFRWLSPPTPESLAKAERLLHQLQATDSSGRISQIGLEMAKLPLEPRYSRLLLAGKQYGCLAETLFIAALVQGEGLFPKDKNASGRKNYLFREDRSDFAGEHRAFDTALSVNFDTQRLVQMGIHARGARETAKIYQQIARSFPEASQSKIDFTDRQDSVALALISAFSDQIAIRLSAGNKACRLTENRKGSLDEHSCALDSDVILACEITEVEARETITHLRLATEVGIDAIESIFPEDFQSIDAAAYDEKRRRVIHRQERRFRDLVLTTKDRDTGVNLDQAAEQLAKRVLSGELILKKWDSKVEQFTARLQCLSEWMPELEMPTWTDEDRIIAISEICHGAVSYKEIKEAAVWPVLNEWLSAVQKPLLDAYCPEWIRLASGHTAKITYAPGNDPFFSAKISQLAGTRETPTIASGKVLLLTHVLAPNQRPWQMTKDLPSFWKTGYPQMKKELAGRYPRHPWP